MVDSKPVKGYEGVYTIFSDGRVQIDKTGKFLTPFDRGGETRLYIRLHDKTRGDSVRSLAKLVAEHFIDGYESDRMVYLKDGDPDNCDVDNIRVSKPREGRRIPPPRALRSRVRIIETGAIFESVFELAEALETHPSSIYRVIRGERPQHRGYTFEFVPRIRYNNRVFN